MTIKDIKEKVLSNKKILGITSVCLVSIIVTTSIFIVKANSTNITEQTKKEDNAVVSEIKNEEETKTEENKEDKKEEEKPKEETSEVQDKQTNSSTPQQNQQQVTQNNNTQTSKPPVQQQPQASTPQQTKPNNQVTPPTPPVVQKPTTPQTPQYKTYTKTEIKSLLNQMKSYGESIGLIYSPGTTGTTGINPGLVGDKIGESHPLFNKNNTSWGEPSSTDRASGFDIKIDLKQHVEYIKQQGNTNFGFLLEKGGQDDEYKNAEGHWTVIVTYA